MDPAAQQPVESQAAATTGTDHDIAAKDHGAAAVNTNAVQAVQNGNDDGVVVEKDLENGTGDLSPEHRDYLIARHGTAELDPLPTMDPADPLNWPTWKVCIATQSIQSNSIKKPVLLVQKKNSYVEYIHRKTPTSSSSPSTP